jgi:Leucine-rich repeat (LRR) protein
MTATLDLTGAQLNSWPELPPALETLILDDNRLAELPDTIGQLTGLKTLSLYRNRLTVVPESLGQLIQLRILNVADNQLAALPDSWGR